MDYQEAIKAVKEYHGLCIRYKLKFDWNLEGLINNPENIKLEVIRKKIKAIKENYPLQKKIIRAVKRMQKTNKTKPNKKRGSKPPKKEINGSTVRVNRPEVEAGIKKRKVTKKRKPRKKKK